MRHLFLLGLFLTLTAAPAEAQSPEASGGLTPDQEAALVGIPVLVTSASALAITRRDEIPLGMVLAFPLVPVASVCATGTVLGLGGDCLQALQSAALLSLPGYGLIGLGLSTDEWEVGLSSLLFGALWLAIVPTFAAYGGYRSSLGRASLSVTPAAVSDPASHRVVPGVQLRLSL
jgi:NADH:ubiquinone oxidoreductase subunit 2 (subunit N)